MRPNLGAVRACATTALLLSLAACGSGSDRDATSTSKATVTVTVTARPTPTATPTEGADAALGSEWSAPQGNRIRVLDYRRAAPGAYVPAGERWDAVLVKACVGSAEGAALWWSPWSLVDADAGQYEASGEKSGDFLAPQYPFAGDKTFANGQCVKGWIYFGVPKQARLRQLTYANDAGEAHTWNLQK